MTVTVSDVRELVPDNPQPATLTAMGDGSTVRFTLPYYPAVLGEYEVRVQNTPQVEVTDYTIDTSTGVITFLVAPPDLQTVTVDYSWTMLSDGYYTRALERNGDSLKLAAADAIGTIARDQALLLKVVRLLDSQMDGATLSRELRQHENGLRKQAEDETEASEDGFAIVEMVPDAFSYRDRVTATWLRGGF